MTERSNPKSGMSVSTAYSKIRADRFGFLRDMIGNTPLLALNYRCAGEVRTIYAKAERFNMTGSIKDRMALHILEQAYAQGRIQPGDRIAEAPSGNTGISFSAIGRALGHQVVIYMPDWMSRERTDLIRSLGAKLVPVSHERGALLDLAADFLVPRIAARQFVLVEPHLHPQRAQRLGQAPRRLAVLRCVA